MMTGIVAGSLIALWALVTGCNPLADGNGGTISGDLELVAALPVEVSGHLEPSGLTISEGTLYAVADKVGTVIYRLEVGEETARMVPAIPFRPPGGGWMDWEGITVDNAGTFYLVSEEQGRILRVSRDGIASWASPDLRPEGRKIGLFTKSNAGFEGIAWLGPNHWLCAVEREPRGLLEVQGADQSMEVQASVQEHSPYSKFLPLLRIPDFSGLHVDGETVYALFRNAHLLVRLDRDGDSFREAEAWSYRHIEIDPRWAFLSQTYGQAEGLVVRGRDVYLLFDNNRGGRMSDPADKRPLLILARIPEGP
ncbi:MAG: SdiA-regulated domain-containing protein [Oceanipulchritudo sp.]